MAIKTFCDICDDQIQDSCSQYEVVMTRKVTGYSTDYSTSRAQICSECARRLYYAISTAPAMPAKSSEARP